MNIDIKKPYTYTYSWPPDKLRNLKAEASQLIALYKKEFGPDWKEYFRDSVKIEVR